MGASSDSTASFDPSLFIAAELREIKKNIKRQNHYLHRLDTEEGRRLEIVDKDMSQLCEEFVHSISQTEPTLT